MLRKEKKRRESGGGPALYISASKTNGTIGKFCSWLNSGNFMDSPFMQWHQVKIHTLWIIENPSLGWNQYGRKRVSEIPHFGKFNLSET